jgi:hypothetical protein
MKLRRTLTVLALVLTSLTGCSLIDEKIKDCPEEITVTCSLNLSSNKDQEMDEKLGTEHDRPVRAALEDYLQHVFVSSVHEVDMYFYDQRKRGKMTHEQHEIMDAGEREFEIRLPASDYRMAGAANVSALPDVTLEGAEGNFDVLRLVQKDARQLPTQPTAVFTARQRMTVRDREDQHYDVHFQMANAAAALIINRDSCDVKGIRAEYAGLADSFKILDSAFAFDNTTLIGTDEIDIVPYTGSDEDVSYETETWVYDVFWTRWKKVPLMVCGVGFPSPNVGSEVIGTYPKIWTIYLYVTMPDNTITRSEIYIGKPLQAGHLLIIKGWLTGEGAFTGTPEHAPYNPDPGGPDFPPGPEPPDPPEPANDSTVVGVSVALDWKEGITINPSL